MSIGGRDKSGFEIAIIGMAGRFPGAKNIDVYWQNLKQGVESIRYFTPEELEARGRRPEDVSDENFVRAHGVLDEMEMFDAEFFGFSPREAEIMDPQHRLFLETVWEGVENAGYAPATFDGLIGVYAGSSVDDYLYANVMQNRTISKVVSAMQASYSNNMDFLATRVSYKLNLRGPSFTVQSACSTSLVAVNLGCQQLLSGACDIAVAGGASITLPQKWGYLYQEGMIMSPDGHCRSFDADAQGCLKGDGVGVVIMKRLEDAIEDGDTIDAVILGSATNNDGDAKVGYTAPGINGQIEVIRSAQMMADVDPDTITYVEAHGTATPMGDPIEVSALTQVFRERTDRKQFCGLGSVKSNFGHLDAAAGIAGLIKTVLALKHRTLPPSINFTQSNPQIDFSNSPFYVNDRCRDWQTDGIPRRAGVSSFGIGGTNAHLVLEEAPLLQAKHDVDTSRYSILPLSARSITALDASSAALKHHIQDTSEQRLTDIAYTLQQGRKNFDCRRVVIARTGAEFVSKVDSPSDASTIGRVLGKTCNVIFLFTGQGSQYLNMAQGLYEDDSSFRQDVDQCAEILLLHLDEDIRSCLYPASDESQDALNARLMRTDIAQPAIFTIEYAIARYWMRMGIKPTALIGHSLGELTAACIADVFSLEDALKLVALRGQLMQSMPSGVMVAVPLPPESVTSYLGESLSLAAINAPSLCVVSGPAEAVEQLQKNLLSDYSVDCKQLHTSHAFHSPMMDPVVEPFQKALEACSIKPAQIPVISTITGRALDQHEEQKAAYWVKNIRETVRFSDAVGQVINGDNTVLLEVGPGNTLVSLAKKHPNKAENIRYVSSLRHPLQKIDDTEHILTSLGQLWIAGAPVNWDQLHQGEARQRAHLPGYPFERQRYWVEPSKEATTALKSGALLTKKADIKDWFYVPSWQRSVEPRLSGDGDTEQGHTTSLLFIDECGLGPGLAKRLEEKGHHVIIVTAGASYKNLTDRTFIINPGKRDDYDSLFTELRSQDKTPSTIIHLWGVTSQEQECKGLDVLDQTLENGFYSLLYLTQALGDLNIWDTLKINIVTSNVHEVTGEETLCPEKAITLGPCKVIPIEYSNITCRHVDIVLPQSVNTEVEMLVTQLERELAGNSSDEIVAYRGRHRWVQTFEPVQLDKQGEGEWIPRLKEEGVYLITGGLGGIGLLLAEHLARTIHAKLVLVGRTPLPERGEWDKWLAEPASADLVEETSDLDQLEKKISGELAIRPMSSYEGLEQILDELCSVYVHEYLEIIGINTSKGESYSKAELREKSKILPKFDKFYNCMITMLEEDGIIRSKDDRLEFLKGREDMKNSGTLKAQAMEKYSEFGGIFRLLEHSVKHYDKALTGEIPAISVLYPEGSSELMRDCETTLSQHTTSQIYEVLLRELISKISAKPRGRKLRILEVGGGNAILTRQIVSALKDADIEYFFTDMGMSFVRKAQQEPSLQDLDCMQFGVLNISEDPVKQGFELNSFDIILGLNVVHATRSIEETTGNLKDLLRPNGIMFLIEAVRLQRWVDMVWGLADGWWCFEDLDIRSDSPLMTLDKWEEVLNSQGFNRVRSFPRNQEKRVVADMGLILAQKKAEHVSSETLDSLSEVVESERFEIQNKIRNLKKLEDMGAEVMVASADVSNLEQMAAVKAQACKQFGSINGIIHSALVLNDGTIQLKTRETAASVLAPKVKGTLVLDTLFKDTKLDFFANFSSLSSIMGGAGQVDYCAASAFLDAYANTNSGRNGVFTVSINWGAWRDVGMFLKSVLERNVRPEEALKEGMSNKDGLESFSRIISSRFSQLLVSPIDLQAMMQRSSPTQKPDSEEVATEAEADPSLVTHHRQEEADNYVAPGNEVEQILADIWQELLGIEQVSIHDNFFELGGDSVISLQIIAKVNQAGFKFTTQQIFEHQTIAELAAAAGSIQASKVDQETASRQDKAAMSSTDSGFSGARMSEDDLARFVDKISSVEDKNSK